MMRAASALFFALVAAPALAQRELPHAPDEYGYTALDSSQAGCNYQYIDLESGGELLALVDGAGNPDGDDGAAELALAQPFEFYGVPATTLVASANGYLAPGADLSLEDGSHWRSDCHLPAIPDNPRASFARLLALAGDLEAGTSGRLFAQQFAECPRPAGNGQAQACTVLQWRDWTRYQGSDAHDFQAVLYHGSWEIALQYRQLAGGLDPDAVTVGVQDQAARSGLTVACGARPLPTPASAVCLFDPRFPPAGVAETIFHNGFEAAD